jgi:acyl carrier protein
VNTLYQLQSIFRDVFENPALKITEVTSIANFPEWDSVATVQIVLAVEAKFHVQLSTDEVAGVKSVADLLKLVDQHA